ALENCLEIGIKSDNIIIDPGIGFAKTLEQNLEILHRLSEFKVLKKPILIGTSRKSFIGNILNRAPNERLTGTIASCVLAATNGAHILRVHDVRPLVQAAAVTDAINNERIQWTL
ncbi:MAG: dihydropteroate synthase, partial [Candidatus Omnitrophica bacterium]|nr:dihydropteroate synthase [Candidatus Omnitrophota bacterium]